MEKLKGWLSREELPADYYELLGFDCFADKRDELLAAVRNATKYLHQYQNHKDQLIVQRARRLQLMCASAANTFSDATKWETYNSQLMSKLRDKFIATQPKTELRKWLNEDCKVSEHCLDDVANFVNVPSNQQFATTVSLGDTRPKRRQDSSTRNPPFTFGSYDVLARLGDGGMGVVFKARHRQLDKLVAIKFLQNEKSVDSKASARFLREMKAIGKLDHPNIVRASDAGEDDQTQFLVMELVDGQNLQDVVESRGTLPVPEACDIVLQASFGLQHAYEQGLVHRDIKPSNLMISRDGTVKILDFGLALLRASGGLTLENFFKTDQTTEGTIVGTIDYMAPEQRFGNQSTDARADVYSLGCTMFFLLTGQAVFAECGADPLQRLTAHSNRAVPPLGRFRSDVPPAVESVMRRMLAKDPDDRFQSGGEVAASLKQAMLVPAPTGSEIRPPAIPESVSRNAPMRSPPAPPPANRPMTPPAQATAPSVRSKPSTSEPAIVPPMAEHSNHRVEKLKMGPVPIVTRDSRRPSAPVAPSPPIAAGTSIPRMPTPSARDDNQTKLTPSAFISNPGRTPRVVWWVTGILVVLTIVEVILILSLRSRRYAHVLRVQTRPGLYQTASSQEFLNNSMAVTRKSVSSSFQELT